MAYISRKDAAELLHVHPQTISNYIKAGLVRRDPNTADNIVRVLEEDIRNLVTDVEELEDLRTSVEDYKQELKDEEKNLEEALKDTKREILNAKSFSGNYNTRLDMVIRVMRTVSNLSCNPLTDREASVLEDLLMFRPMSEIAQKNSLTRARVREIGIKAIRRFKGVVVNGVYKRVYTLEMENIKLKEENNNLKKEVAVLEKYRTPETNAEIESAIRDEPGIIEEILDTNIMNEMLSVRTLNCLIMLKITTLRNLAAYSQNEIKRYRGLGKKTFLELENLLEKYGLNWGMCNKNGTLKHPLNERQLAAMAEHRNGTNNAKK